MFQNPPIHYEPSPDRYVLNNSPAKPMTSGSGITSATAFDPSDPAADTFDIPPRPADTDIKALTFWNGLFPEAMASLKLRAVAPSTKPKHIIRDKSNWDAVYETLETARGEYQVEDGTRKLWRKV
jgi:hypothetical protein